MRILMVAEQMFLGGLETHVMTLCRQLIARKHNIYIYLSQCIGPWHKMLADCGVVSVNSPEEAHPLDVIHLHVWGQIVLKALSWSKQYQVPLVATYHGLYRTYLDELQDKAEIICVSKSIHEFLGVDAMVIENGIDLDRFDPSPLPLSRTVAWLGRLDGKRWLTLDALFRACEMTKTRCRVVGAFLPPEAIDMLTAYPHVEWCGAVFDVSPLIRDVDIIFSTSRGIRETMASSRIAIVANDVWYGGVVGPSTVEMLRHSSFMAWRNRPLLTSMIAKDLTDLYANPRTMANLSRWGNRYARRSFSSCIMASATEHVYARAIEAYHADFPSSMPRTFSY